MIQRLPVPGDAGALPALLADYGVRAVVVAQSDAGTAEGAMPTARALRGAAVGRTGRPIA